MARAWFEHASWVVELRVLWIMGHGGVGWGKCCGDPAFDLCAMGCDDRRASCQLRACDFR